MLLMHGESQVLQETLLLLFVAVLPPHLYFHLPSFFFFFCKECKANMHVAFVYFKVKAKTVTRIKAGVRAGPQGAGMDHVAE